MFTDEQYMSAGEKAVVLADWSRFIKNGFRDVDFTVALYKHLTLHCSFIAHTDRLRFHEFDFADTTAALSAFMNQFGGSKIAVETHWQEWRSGTASDLKEAMCAEATEFFPTFERVVGEYALERYEAEKWGDAGEKAAELPQRMQNAEAMSHMGLLFEMVFPFESYLHYLGVDEELRRRLTVAQEIIFAPPAPEVPAWSLNGRAAETTAVHSLSLFGEREEAMTLPPIAAGESNLARQIAALSAVTETAQTAPPLIIEDKRTLYAEK